MAAPPLPPRPPQPTNKPSPQPIKVESKSVGDVLLFLGVFGGGFLLAVGLIVLEYVKAPKKEPGPMVVYLKPGENKPKPPITPPRTSTPKVEPKKEPPTAPKTETKPPEPKKPPKEETKPPEPKKPEEKPKPKAPEKPEPKIVFYDNQGNPVGENLGLAQDGEFNGKKILVWYMGAASNPVTRLDNPMWKALEKKGFKIQIGKGAFNPAWLKEVDLLWLFCSPPRTTYAFKEKDYQAVIQFVRDGKGLYLIADNDPFFVEANEIGKRLFGIKFQDNYQGEKIAYVKERKLTPEKIRKYNGQYEINDHPLLRHVDFLYEGITISNFTPSDKVKVILKASNGKPLAGVSQVKGLNVVVDCGFTRYYWGGSKTSSMTYVTKAAGTIRYGENICAYLLGKR